MNTTNHMKKTLLSALALALFLTAVPGDVRAEGELAWQFNGAPASIHYTDVAVSSAGVFSPRLISWGEVAVRKRNLDNSGGWGEVSFPIPVGSWFNGHPRIAADSTGVYVALSSAVTIDVRNGTLSMAKLSPVDGAILSIKNSNAPGYVNVTNIEVDSTGVYVSGGSSADRGYGSTSWRLEKWDKDLSGVSPIWGYSSNYSGGNAGDYWGPLGFAMNNQYIYLGGNRLNAGSGALGVRIEKINKNTGVAEWIRLEGYGTGAVGMLALSNTNLYSVLSNSYWGGASFGVGTSVFEIRPLDNLPAVSAVAAPGRIHALAVDGVSGLYRAYIANGDGTSRTIIDKVSLVDGSQIGALTVNTSVYSVTKYPSGFGFATPIVNNLSTDNNGIYIAGKDEAALVWGVSGSPRIEKYNHFGSVSGACGSANGIPTATAPTPTPAVPPNNLCASGTVPIVTDAGVSFNWTCDGPDNLDATADDVACSAQKPPILSLCTTSGIPVAVASAIPYSRALLVGSSESFNAFYDATPNICTDSAPITDATWTDGLVAPIVSLVAASASPQTVTASLVGNERVEVVKESDRIFIDYTVGMPCVSSCTPARRAQECSGVTFPETDSCGVAETCAGTRYCDFNWKEVAPGQ